MDSIRKRKHNAGRSPINATIGTYTRITGATRQGNTKSDKTRNDGDTSATKVLTSLEKDAERAQAKGRSGEGRGVGWGENKWIGRWMYAWIRVAVKGEVNRRRNKREEKRTRILKPKEGREEGRERVCQTNSTDSSTSTCGSTPPRPTPQVYENIPLLCPPPPPTLPLIQHRTKTGGRVGYSGVDERNLQCMWLERCRSRIQTMSVP